MFGWTYTVLPEGLNHARVGGGGGGLFGILWYSNTLSYLQCIELELHFN